MTNPSPLSDKWIFLLCPLLALAAVHIGNDNTPRELIGMPTYYSDLALALFAAFGCVLYLRRLYIYLNRAYGWHFSSRNRLFLQALGGVVLPTVAILTIEVIYLIIIGIDLKESSFLYLELPLVFIFCTLINLIYTMLYHRKSLLELKQSGEGWKPEVTNRTGLGYYSVQSGATMLNIPAERVAYFIVLEKQTFLVTIEGKRYLYPSPVSKLAEILPAENFFRLNRQVIATRSSIRQYENTGTRRLTVDLDPSPGVPVYVAKARAAAFGRWLQG